jgi:hypothetical protein
LRECGLREQGQRARDEIFLTGIHLNYLSGFFFTAGAVLEGLPIPSQSSYPPVVRR